MASLWSLYPANNSEIHWGQIRLDPHNFTVRIHNILPYGSTTFYHKHPQNFTINIHKILPYGSTTFCLILSKFTSFDQFCRPISFNVLFRIRVILSDLVGFASFGWILSVHLILPYRVGSFSSGQNPFNPPHFTGYCRIRIIGQLHFECKIP